MRSDKTALLIDVGINSKTLASSLYKARTDLDEINGILITHEHSDHISGLGPAEKRLTQSKIFGSRGTFEAIPPVISEGRQECFDAGDNFHIGDIEVVTFSVSHDAADPVGYTFRHEGKVLSIVTDTGIFTEEILRETADADILVVESNHDVGLLKTGRYPQFLKSRILGEYGHLSNVQAANAVLDVMGMDRKPRCVLLAHLSRDNNDPRLAEKTVSDILIEADVYPGRELFLKPLLRGCMSVVFEI